MKSFSIKAQKRTDLGKKNSKQLRAANQVPCVMYGGQENIHFYAHANDFRKMIYTDQVYVIELDIDGNTAKAVLKEIQFHPVTDAILHIDFVQVFDDKPAVVTLPVKLTGTSEGILAGGKLRLRRRVLKVKGLVKDMPDSLEIDITKLNIGDVTKVADLNYDKLELLDPSQSMVVGIVSSRLAAKGMTAEEGGGAEIGEAEGETEGGEETTEEAPKAE